MTKQEVARTVRSLLFLLAIAPCLAGRLFAADPAARCATNTETRQLDYWLGNWAMPNSEKSGTSLSKVSLSLDQCMFVERWDNGQGHVTQKMFAYSPEDKSWYGMFADNEGRVHVFLDGKVSSGGAEFHGPSRGSNGEAVLNRLKIVRLTANTIEEVWEKSTDKGVNWTTAYRAEYFRANP
jgi:hypothetical protein